MKYEYKSITLGIVRNLEFFSRSVSDDSARIFEEQLNRLGDQGWELVGVWPVTNGGSPAQINQAEL
ncbi:MAG: DUF4177 domain-containing protein [Planctomycetes bacterium]|nr:DUF4177 domain-containing protein [Planctomycetota bacterium]